MRTQAAGGKCKCSSPYLHSAVLIWIAAHQHSRCHISPKTQQLMQNSCIWMHGALQETGLAYERCEFKTEIWPSWPFTLHAVIPHNTACKAPLQVHNSRTLQCLRKKKRKQSEQCCLWTKNYRGMLVSIKSSVLLRAGCKDSMIKAGKWDGSVFTINLISFCCAYTHTYVYRIEMPQYILSQMTAAAYTHLWACTMRAAVGSHWLWWHSTHIQQSR